MANAILYVICMWRKLGVPRMTLIPLNGQSFNKQHYAEFQIIGTYVLIV